MSLKQRLNDLSRLKHTEASVNLHAYTATTPAIHCHCKLNFHCTGGPFSKRSTYNGSVKFIMFSYVRDGMGASGYKNIYGLLEELWIVWKGVTLCSRFMSVQRCVLLQNSVLCECYYVEYLRQTQWKDIWRYYHIHKLSNAHKLCCIILVLKTYAFKYF